MVNYRKRENFMGVESARGRAVCGNGGRGLKRQLEGPKVPVGGLSCVSGRDLKHQWEGLEV